jgi:excisionase family DNA binding protein
VSAPQTISVADVARLLRVTPARVYELCRAGVLPHARLGRQVRIAEDELEAFIRAGGRPLPPRADA